MPSQSSATSGQRYRALCQWAAEPYYQLNGETLHAPESLSGDAGARRYYRLPGQPPLLLVDAPPAGENSERFVALAEDLRAAGVHTPRVLASDTERGFLLIEDFGDRLLHGELNTETVPTLYGEALFTLLALQQAPRPAYLGDYNQGELRREMALFPEWFADKLLGHRLSETDRALLEDTFTRLEACAAEQPRVLVHRDYHSRNLLLAEGGTLGVIDFQDAVWGPLTYDAVSLLRDCYIRWPREQVRQWALAYGNMAAEVGLLGPVGGERFLRWFDWMGLQRHIKVLGIFARLHLRDGKDGYLADLPLVMRYTLEVADAHPELADFADWFRRTLLPLAERQSWYRDYQRAGDRT